MDEKEKPSLCETCYYYRVSLVRSAGIEFKYCCLPGEEAHKLSMEEYNERKNLGCRFFKYYGE